MVGMRSRASGLGRGRDALPRVPTTIATIHPASLSFFAGHAAALPRLAGLLDT
jgi:hypothetical protein